MAIGKWAAGLAIDDAGSAWMDVAVNMAASSQQLGLLLVLLTVHVV